MTDVPIYTLTCESGAAAERFAEILRARGFVGADFDHGTLTVRWGGPFQGLADIYDLGRNLGVATDQHWSEFLMQGADAR
jgi:hypothetical protein